jgi:ADP-ribosylglycohydrolase
MTVGSKPAPAECDCGGALTPLGDDIRFRCGGCAALFAAKPTDRTPPPLLPLAITKGGFSYRRLDPRTVHWTYSKEELDRIRKGLVVQSQDGKWGSVERNNWIYFHRASFGTLQFVAHLSDTGIDEVQIARDIRSVRDLKYVRWLLDTVLAGRDVPFSAEFHKTAEQVAHFRGALLGLAAGDALGTTLEFEAAGSFEPINDMVGGGPFGLKPGEWTDDTSMALCLAESLVERKGFDPVDQLERYLRWYRDGHLSSNGRCFDIGNTVRASLTRFEATHDPYCGPEDPRSAGNGSIMRLAPVAMAYARRPREAIERAGESSRTTHGAREAIDACRYLAALLVGALRGVSKDELLSRRFTPVPGYWEEHPLAPAIDEIACGSFTSRQPPEIKGTGYVVRSLEAALWAFYRSTAFSEGCLRAVNLGDDADTTGAVYGQLAGAFYGEQEIPLKWMSCLARRPLLETMAERVLEFSRTLDDPSGP